MSILTPEQQQHALEVMREYLAAPRNADGRTPVDLEAESDRNRAEIIDGELKPLLDAYLAGQVPLDEFKSKVDSINKRHEHWGFKGSKGQMFFNVVVNVAADDAECDQELKAAISLPASEDMARSRIRTFASYVNRIGEQHIERGGSKHARPRVSSIPFFLSYFWQIHDRRVWPVYYTNGVNTMVDLNLWQPGDDLADNYVAFKHIHEELAELFARESGKSFGLYEVEHVFWFRGGNPYEPVVRPKPDGGAGTTVVLPPPISRLPDSYVPPIVAILPRMAMNEPELIQAAKASGTSLERAFEKSVNAAFTILGYDTTLLGQGQGRVPDGRAVDVDNGYAILWDAKVRSDGYSMGTDDRTIREYIRTQSRQLKHKRSLRNIYYLIVSSSFRDDYDDAIKALKMETDVNEVCLVEADAIVAMVDAKLRDPQQLTLGPDGLQRLFSGSGVLTSDMVRETLA
ncbi:MAG TPA: hypothetical protein VMZ31_04435 [Phycisphaerae bacterium]|nr:hypothetical protein [Phycisphaerae bacterium]